MGPLALAGGQLRFRAREVIAAMRSREDWKHQTRPLPWPDPALAREAVAARTLARDRDTQAAMIGAGCRHSGGDRVTLSATALSRPLRAVGSGARRALMGRAARVAVTARGADAIQVHVTFDGAARAGGRGAWVPDRRGYRGPG